MKSELKNKQIFEYKNYVFLGETGSGKTELAMNLALYLAENRDGQVHFFDMDQTKPLFRARDTAGVLEREGIIFHFQMQYLDAPTLVPGVIERLIDEGSIVLLDVGGGSHGSHMIGQFSHILKRENTCVFYLVNPYRAWSGSAEEIEKTMARVAGAARLSKVELVANPNLGPETTADDVVAGEMKLREMFPNTPISFLCAMESISEELEGRIAETIFPIKLNTIPDWMN